MQLMQGEIWIAPNSKGFDQSVAIILPFQLKPSIILGISDCGVSSNHTNPYFLFEGLKVLLADYDDLNRVVTRRLLEKLGCIVSTVSSGYDCLGALGPAVSSFQVVFLELNLPDLDGFEVAMRIRKFQSRNFPLIIALTASSDEDMSARCLQIGMNGIIRKPVLLQGIADELQRVLLLTNRIISP